MLNVVGYFDQKNDSKCLEGKGVETVNERKSKNTVRRVLKIDFEIAGGTTKTKLMNLRSVKLMGKFYHCQMIKLMSRSILTLLRVRSACRGYY